LFTAKYEAYWYERGQWVWLVAGRDTQGAAVEERVWSLAGLGRFLLRLRGE
jgi:hypothetical protein